MFIMVQPKRYPRTGQRSGVFGALYVGSATKGIWLFGGLSGAQTFATGAANYNIMAILISTFTDADMELIECE